MSEVPSGLTFETPPQPTIRDSASLMLTRINKNKIEVLLGKRSETMKAFPNFWSFPGGGLSRKDLESVNKLNINNEEFASMKICIIRELCEELGLSIYNGELISVDPKLEKLLLKTKKIG